MKVKYFLFILILFQNCSKIKKQEKKIYKKDEFYEAIESSSIISFRINKNSNTRRGRNDSLFTKEPIFHLKNEKNKIEFKNLFIGVKLTEYCCCPNLDFKIEFKRSNKLNNYFFLDTSSISDSIVLVQNNFQFCKKISKKSWDKYLDNLKNN